MLRSNSGDGPTPSGRPATYRGSGIGSGNGSGSPSLVPSPPQAAPAPSSAARPRHGGLSTGANPKRRLDASAAGSASSADDASDHVRFADVQIREYERVALEPGNDGGPKLGLGWKARKDTFRRLDSLERERDGVHIPGKELHPLSLEERRAIVLSARDLLSETLSPKPEADDGVPAVKEVYDAELDLWHMSPEGNVHHTGGITSRVSGVEGRVVITAAHGSRYRLKRIKPEVLRVLDRIGIPFDESHPLDNVSSVVYAAAVMQLEPQMLEARRLLTFIESALTPFGNSVEECFGTMNQAMQALGFPTV